MTAPATAEAIRDVNTRYHDVAASSYDSKWGIDFGDPGQTQVLAKLAKALGERPARPFQRSLEIGSGTGYFSLNLLRAGAVEAATATDISPGMLAKLRANAQHLGVDVTTEVSDAERLPFADGSFDLVFGHAVLHHLPDLQLAFSEFARVLAPGGVIVFAGEPSQYGDRLASIPKRAAWRAAPLWRALMRAAPNDEGAGIAATERTDHALESQVDVHAFAPAELDRLARDAGLGDVRVRGEELLANWFGWANRALEASAQPDEIPWAWRRYAYHGYLLLQRVDAALLEPRLPAAAFYNLLLSARKPR